MLWSRSKITQNCKYSTSKETFTPLAIFLGPHPEHAGVFLMQEVNHLNNVELYYVVPVWWKLTLTYFSGNGEEKTNFDPVNLKQILFIHKLF